MDKKKENKEENSIAKEPMAAYHTKADMLAREIPDYVWEDVRIGMEQYKRGECTDAFEFLRSLRK